MNKSEWIRATAQRAGLPVNETTKALNAALELIALQLSQGDKVQLSGFGSFELREREARMGRNIHTGEALSIPASQVPVFKPSKTLKDIVGK